MVVGANYRVEAGLVGDARLCLAALGAEIARRLEGSPARPAPPSG
jgi:acetolactate synthase-1/2/3 large subunit